jgi:hypothetical protein
MCKSATVAGLVLTGWAWLAAGQWVGVAHAQQILLDVTDTMTAPHPLNPKGARFFAKAHTVNLTAGQSYVIRMRPTTVGPDSYIYLLNSSGTVVGQDDDGDAAAQIWASKLVYTATSTGSYTIIATTFVAGASFQYRVWVETLPPPAPATPLTVPGSVSGSLSTSDPGNPRGAAYFAHRYTVTLTAGQDYTIRMTPTRATDDSYIYLLDSSGRIVGQDDDGDHQFQTWASKLVYKAASTGTYTIVATSFSPGRAFDYRISIETGTGGIPNVRLGPSRPADVRPASTEFAHVLCGDRRCDIRSWIFIPEHARICHQA